MRVEDVDLKGLSISLISEKVQETYQMGVFLGKSSTPGDVIALIGELGSGKTQIAKGIAKGLKVPRNRVVTSPSYTLINEYTGRIPFYHIDLYRLRNLEEIYGLGYEEYLYGQGVAVIEWADRAIEILPDEHFRVDLAITGRCSRRLKIRGKGNRYLDLVIKLKAYLKE